MNSFVGAYGSGFSKSQILGIVAEAEDGETVIELVSQVLLDIVLLDVGLSGIVGIEACRQIKQRQPICPS